MASDNTPPPPLRSHLGKVPEGVTRIINDLAATEWDIEVSFDFQTDQEMVRWDQWEALEEDGILESDFYRHQVAVRFRLPAAMNAFMEQFEMHRSPGNRDPFVEAFNANADGTNYADRFTYNIPYNNAFMTRFVEPRGYQDVIQVAFDAKYYPNTNPYIGAQITLPEHMHYWTVSTVLFHLRFERNELSDWDDIEFNEDNRTIVATIRFVIDDEPQTQQQIQDMKNTNQLDFADALTILMTSIVEADRWLYGNNDNLLTLFRNTLNNNNDIVNIPVRKNGTIDRVGFNSAMHEGVAFDGGTIWNLKFDYEVGIPGGDDGEEHLYADDEWEEQINGMKEHMGAVMAAFCTRFLPSSTTNGYHAREAGPRRDPANPRWKLNSNQCHFPAWWRELFANDGGVRQITVLNNVAVRIQDDNYVVNENPKLKF